jgi:hypothetical protein
MDAGCSAFPAPIARARATSSSSARVRRAATIVASRSVRVVAPPIKAAYTVADRCAWAYAASVGMPTITRQGAELVRAKPNTRACPSGNSISPPPSTALFTASISGVPPIERPTDLSASTVRLMMVPDTSFTEISAVTGVLGSGAKIRCIVARSRWAPTAPTVSPSAPRIGASETTVGRPSRRASNTPLVAGSPLAMTCRKSGKSAMFSPPGGRLRPFAKTAPSSDTAIRLSC